MSSKTKGQPHAFPVLVVPKIEYGYCAMEPNLFDSLFKKHSDFVDSVSLQIEGVNYKEGSNQWGTVSEIPCASVWANKDSSDLIVWVATKGWLFTCQGLLEVTELIAALRANEALNIDS